MFKLISMLNVFDFEWFFIYLFLGVSDIYNIIERLWYGIGLFFVLLWLLEIVY